jgi:phage baseplate assembly protein W
MKESLPLSSARPTLQALYRAWGFLHPDFIHPELDIGSSGGQTGLQQAGLQLVDGRLNMVSGADSVRQSILLLLSTRPGERLMRPEYGCDLYRLVFAPNDEMTAGLAIHYVRQAVERWEPRADIVRLDAGRDPEEPDRLNIVLEYRLRVTQQTEQLFFSLDLTGGNS